MPNLDQHRIVILEKNQGRRDYIRSIVSGRGDLPVIFEKETICLDNLLSLQPDLVISGSLSNSKVYRFVNTVKMMDGNLPVLIITGDRSIKDFADSTGFSDVKVLKTNFELTEIKGAIGSLIRRRYAGNGNGDPENPLIIGNNPEIIKIKKRIADLKNLSEPVLIQGEPGTGKELIARAIHHQSHRCNSPFSKIQLAELNPELLDSIISGIRGDDFNYPKLNISVAEKLTSGGTLFLNEIAALPAVDQSRLLAVFEACGQDGAGKRRSIKKNPDLAIVISSSSVISQLVKTGKFRKDLFYRMSVISIEVPPLRDRIDDIPLLTDFFADKFCMEYGAGHTELPRKIKDSFCRYPWPGNVRELKSIVQRAVLYGLNDSVIKNLTEQWARGADSSKYDEELFSLTGLSKIQNYLKEQDSPTLKSVRDIFLLRTEKALIKKALEKTNWNRKKAATLLEISYKSLLNKIKEYELA